MTTADSNVYLRLLLGDLPDQAEVALAWLELQPAATILVVDSVLVEVLFLLESKRTYGLARAEFLPGLLRLISSGPWQILSLTARALSLYGDSKLDYVECLLWAMQSDGEVTKVATFDKDLQNKLGGSVL